MSEHAYRTNSLTELLALSEDELQQRETAARADWITTHPAPQTPEAVEAARQRLDVAPILKQYGSWAVTTDGVECLTESYTIAREDVHDDDWERHLAEKIWIVVDDVAHALDDARTRWPKKTTKARS